MDLDAGEASRMNASNRHEEPSPPLIADAPLMTDPLGKGVRISTHEAGSMLSSSRFLGDISCEEVRRSEGDQTGLVNKGLKIPKVGDLVKPVARPPQPLTSGPALSGSLILWISVVGAELHCPFQPRLLDAGRRLRAS